MAKILRQFKADNRDDIFNCLYFVMQIRDLTLRDIGTSAGTIALWRRGDITPKLKTILDILKKAGITMLVSQKGRREGKKIKSIDDFFNFISNINCQELAASVDVDVSTLYHLKKRDNVPRLESSLSIIHAMGYKVYLEAEVFDTPVITRKEALDVLLEEGRIKDALTILQRRIKVTDIDLEDLCAISRLSAWASAEIVKRLDKITETDQC